MPYGAGIAVPIGVEKVLPNDLRSSQRPVVSSQLYEDGGESRYPFLMNNEK